jgi:hypothetical protein
MIDWNKIKKEETIIIHKIAHRAVQIVPDAGCSLLDIEMDVTACHIYNPLKLQDLLDAPDGDFGHDIFGIARFLNRETGKLGCSFLPRFARLR